MAIVGVVVRGLRSGVFGIIIAEAWGWGASVVGPVGLAIFTRVALVGLRVVSAIIVVGAGLSLGVLVVMSRIKVVVIKVDAS